MWKGDPLLFCHIPKCAGTSFRSVVEAEYRDNQRLFWYPGPDGDVDAQRAQLAEAFHRNRPAIRIVYGHFSFGLHQTLDTPPIYATILRDPVERVVSLYHHVGRTPRSPLFALVKEGLSLTQFVAGRYTEMTNNQMTRILAGIKTRPGEIVDSREAIQRAKENVEKYFGVIGTVEEMSDVVRVIGNRSGWRRHQIPNLNVTTQPRAWLEKETLGVVEEYNHLDRELYEWVRTRSIADK
ncbi:MAG: sulfotransferase family 2 domain-containing protein [Nitrospirota bacterium]